MIKRKQISKKEALSAFEITRNIPVRLVTADIHKAFEIAMRFNIYAHDAYFIKKTVFLAHRFDDYGNEISSRLSTS